MAGLSPHEEGHQNRRPCRESRRALTVPSRRSRRRRGPVTRPPSPAQEAWSFPQPPPLHRSSPSPACGSRSRPAAAPSAAPARTSEGRGPGRVRCRWKIWKKGRSGPEDEVTYPCSQWESDISASRDPAVKKPKHLIKPPTHSSPVLNKLIAF